MSLYIGKRTYKKEFGHTAIPDYELATLRRSYAKGKGVVLGNRPEGTILKVYGTSKRGARRIVLFYVGDCKSAFILFYRPKKDRLAINIARQNKVFAKTLKERLILCLADIENGDFIKLF